MSVEILDERLEDPGTEPAREPGARPVSARQAGVAMAVCLLLWGLLAAPALERNAAAAPVGARRAAALAVLRPLVAVSERLGLVAASDSFLRALGRDPDEQPGGELVLPPIDLPPEVAAPSPVAPSPTVVPEPPEPEPAPGGESDPPDEVEEPDPTLLREPTPDNRLRVVVIGDSLSQGLGPAIERWMDPDLVRVLSLGRQSTGLSRRDYFNWQAGMRQIVEGFRPDLVFILLGSNDAQAQIAPDGTAIPVGSVAWVEGYRDQASRLLTEATSAGTRVVWVGIPIVEDRRRWDFYRRVNGIYREVARSDPLAVYLDTWSLFATKDGDYRAYVRNERGLLQLMRAPDGIHFTPTGYAYLGRTAIRAAAEAFGLVPQAVTFRL
jgi:hypothetical protein